MNCTQKFSSTVNVFYTCNKIPFSKEQWDNYIQCMPDNFTKRILKFIRWEDRQNSLTGRLLLQYGLSYLNYQDTLPEPSKLLDSIKLTSYGKPFFSLTTQPEKQPVFKKKQSALRKTACFNISHSGSYCICGIHTSEIGVDIEQIKPVELKDFYSILTGSEQKFINKSSDPFHGFYTIWTRKEAVIKALGTGFSTDLTSFCAAKNHTVLDGVLWYTYPIIIDSAYISHIALRKQNPKISVHQLFF